MTSLEYYPGMNAKTPVGQITERERRIMELIVQYGTMVEAARREGVSYQTVKNQLNAARDRTGSISTYALFYRYGTGEFDGRDAVRRRG